MHRTAKVAIATLVSCAVVIGCGQEASVSQSFSDRQIFQGVMFGTGSVASRVPEARDQLRAEFYVSDPGELAAMARVQDAITDQIARDDPTFLAAFARAARSGDPAKVRAMLVRANTAVSEAAGAFQLSARGQNLPIDTRGQNLPIDTRGQNLPVDTRGQNLPVDLRGQNLPVDHAGRTSPSTHAGRTSPLTHAGRTSPSTPAGRISPSTSAGRTSPSTPAGRISLSTPAGRTSPSTSAGRISPSTPAGRTSPSTPAGRISLSTPAGRTSPSTSAGRISPSTPARGQNLPVDTRGQNLPVAYVRVHPAWSLFSSQLFTEQLAASVASTFAETPAER